MWNQDVLWTLHTTLVTTTTFLALATYTYRTTPPTIRLFWVYAAGLHLRDRRVGLPAVLK